MLIAYIDGGARGNPGPAGYGVHLEGIDGLVIAELHGGLGIATNNVAEYNGLLAALRYAAEHGHRQVRIRADSELLVRQMRGEYRVKHAGLKPLFLEACSLIRRIEGRKLSRPRLSVAAHVGEPTLPPLVGASLDAAPVRPRAFALVAPA